jgi:hypothetical protein
VNFFSLSLSDLAAQFDNQLRPDKQASTVDSNRGLELATIEPVPIVVTTDYCEVSL